MRCFRTNPWRICTLRQAGGWPQYLGATVAILKLLRRVPLLAFFSFAAIGPSCAALGSPATVSRHVLALYDGHREATPTDTVIHRLAEFPLNYLGYIVHYHDIHKPLPAPAEMLRYKAVLTWFDSPISNPIEYVRWITEVARSQVRLIVLGEPGPDPYSPALRLTNQIFAILGLRHAGQMIGVTANTRIVKKDAALLEFERALDTVLPPFPAIRATNASVESALELEDSGRKAPQITTLVTTGPAGGFAASGYIYYYDQYADRLRWVLDPFAFFRKALGGQIFPIPDVTTQSGRRIYFSHVEGDGWNNAVQVEGSRDKNVLASEVLLRELIEPYPDLPVSLGLIAGDVDERLGGRPRSADIARRWLALPQVELASHTYTNPFKWSFFETYNREQEIKLAGLNAGGDILKSLGWFGAASATGELPRAYPRDPFAIDVEVSRAIEVIETLSPQGKRARLYLWSGDNRPFEQMLRATRKAQLRNLNGGDSRFNVDYPSIAYLSPIGRMVGSERQIYAAAGSENFPLDSSGHPRYGFAAFSESLLRTETPRRLKAFNLHYSVHAAEHRASLLSLQSSLELTRKQSLLPITASQYAAIADGFFDAEIVQLGELRWAIRNRGALQTVRFDGADDVAVDLERSVGVLGQNRHAGVLYVALDNGVIEPVIALTLAGSSKSEKEAGPMLKGSRWSLEALSRRPCSAAFRAQGFGQGEMEFEGLQAGPRLVTVTRAGQSLWQQSIDVSVDGTARFTIPVAAIEPVDVTINCATADVRSQQEAK
jgi:polysaccharide biosynthesis protein PelA